MSYLKSILMLIYYGMGTVVAQGHKRVTVNATGSEFHFERDAAPR